LLTDKLLLHSRRSTGDASRCIGAEGCENGIDNELHAIKTFPATCPTLISFVACLASDIPKRLRVTRYSIGCGKTRPPIAVSGACWPTAFMTTPITGDRAVYPSRWAGGLEGGADAFLNMLESIIPRVLGRSGRLRIIRAFDKRLDVRRTFGHANLQMP
jgi:hypothetical protein